MKQCSNPACGQLDDGERPIKVHEAVLTIEYGAESVTIAGPLCQLCRHDMIKKLAAYFPAAKLKRIANPERKDGVNVSHKG